MAAARNTYLALSLMGVKIEPLNVARYFAWRFIMNTSTNSVPSTFICEGLLFYGEKFKAQKWYTNLYKL
jgi:hypothetical protein